MAVITLLVPLAVWVSVRARPDLDAAQPVGSARRYRVYLRGTARLMMLLVTALNLTVLLDGTPGWEVVAVVPTAVVVIVFVGWSAWAGQAGHRLPAMPGR